MLGGPLSHGIRRWRGWHVDPIKKWRGHCILCGMTHGPHKEMTWILQFIKMQLQSLFWSTLYGTGECYGEQHVHSTYYNLWYYNFRRCFRSHHVWWEIVISFIIFTTTRVDGVIDKRQHVWELVFHDNIPSICMSTLICIGVVIDTYMNVHDTLLTSRWMTF